MEEAEDSVTHMGQLESNASLFSCVKSFFWDAWLTCAYTTSECHRLSVITQCCPNGCGSPYEEQWFTRFIPICVWCPVM